MKVSFAVLLLVMTCSLALAQLRQQTDSVLEIQKITKYKSLRNGGILLTVIGGGLLIGGVVTATNSLDFYDASSSNTGEGLAIAGAILVGAGVPMIVVGEHNYRKHKHKAMPMVPSSLVQQPDAFDTSLFQQRKLKYKTLRNAGIIMSIVGGGLLIAGAARSDSFYIIGLSATNTGEGMLIAGTILVGAGIPMMAVGTHNYRKYSSQLQGSPSARLSIQPRINGLSLVLHY